MKNKKIQWNILKNREGELIEVQFYDHATATTEEEESNLLMKYAGWYYKHTSKYLYIANFMPVHAHAGYEPDLTPIFKAAVVGIRVI